MLGPHDGFLLRLFGVHVEQGFGQVAYQVGSSLKQKRGWRDVDVRLLLPDDEFEQHFGDPMYEGWQAPKLGMWNLAWTALGKQMTDLPIDFQIQSVTLANEKYPDPRSALIMLDAELPTVYTGG